MKRNSLPLPQTHTAVVVKQSPHMAISTMHMERDLLRTTRSVFRTEVKHPAEKLHDDMAANARMLRRIIVQSLPR